MWLMWGRLLPCWGDKLRLSQGSLVLSWHDLKELIHNGGPSLEDEGRVFESYHFSVNFPHDDYTKEPPTSSEIEATQGKTSSYLICAQLFPLNLFDSYIIIDNLSVK